MLKEFILGASAVVLIAANPGVQAQVYKCDGPSGTVFSDMPCGESAEEIVVEGMEPGREAVVGESESAEIRTPEQQQNYSNFLGVLNSQKLFKIEEVDRKLTTLRVAASSAEFAAMSEADKQQITNRIAGLELEKEAIVAEYDGLIAEMERRIESEEASANAQEQLQ